jgi:predicted RND superfamily exporter protein
LGTFFSLVFSPHQGAASIGLLLTLAISIMLVLSLSLLPTLLTFFDQRGYFGQTVSKPTEIMNT